MSAHISFFARGLSFVFSRVLIVFFVPSDNILFAHARCVMFMWVWVCGGGWVVVVVVVVVGRL